VRPRPRTREPPRRTATEPARDAPARASLATRAVPQDGRGGRTLLARRRSPMRRSRRSPPSPSPPSSSSRPSTRDPYSPVCLARARTERRASSRGDPAAAGAVSGISVQKNPAANRKLENLARCADLSSPVMDLAAVSKRPEVKFLQGRRGRGDARRWSGLVRRPVVLRDPHDATVARFVLKLTLERHEPGRGIRGRRGRIPRNGANRRSVTRENLDL
jgi:hypothetical protein